MDSEQDQEVRALPPSPSFNGPSGENPCSPFLSPHLVSVKLKSKPNPVIRPRAIIKNSTHKTEHRVSTFVPDAKRNHCFFCNFCCLILRAPLNFLSQVYVCLADVLPPEPGPGHPRASILVAISQFYSVIITNTARYGRHVFVASVYERLPYHKAIHICSTPSVP